MKNLRIIFSVLFLLNSFFAFSQEKKRDLDDWKKAVVNIETEGFIQPQHMVDSLLQSKVDSGYNVNRLDSFQKTLNVTQINTGTAIYVQYNSRRYLITAKHVLFDLVGSNQKEYLQRTNQAKFKNFEAIFPRISIRTPFDFYLASKRFNNAGITYSNFTNFANPYFFVSDSTGDGIGCLSLQEINYKILDSLLQLNGYKAIDISKIDTSNNLRELDEIYAIGFPEGVSSIASANTPQNLIFSQLQQLVASFTVQGRIAMFNKNIQHYYVDLTITPGNSGSPIIKNGKLIGIVSALNKYRIIDESGISGANQNLYGIGHLVAIINVRSLLSAFRNYQDEENQLLRQEKINP